jgi:small subunit ribosomal protein S15
MAFPKCTILAVIAASACLMSADAFAPVAPSVSVASGARSVSASVPQQLMSTLEDVDEEVEDFIVNAGDLDDSAAEITADDSDGTLNRFFHEERIAELRTQYRLHDTDSGSPEYQVAGMTERISYLTKHLRAHPKDFSTRRGLVALVNKRRRLLNFLFREDVNRYKNLVQGLGIRHKPPSKVQTKDEQYGRFNPQKTFKGKSKMK